MPKVCAVLHCGATTHNTQDRSFHQFPQDSSLRNAWRKRIKREHFQLSNNSSVCSNHFGEEHFRKPNSETPAQFRKATLKPGSLPTYHLQGRSESFASTSGMSVSSHNFPKDDRITSNKEKRFRQPKPRKSERCKTASTNKPTKVCHFVQESIFWFSFKCFSLPSFDIQTSVFYACHFTVRILTIPIPKLFLRLKTSELSN